VFSVYLCASALKLKVLAAQHRAVTSVIPCCGCWSVVDVNDPRGRPRGQLFTNPSCDPRHFSPFEAIGVRVLPCGAPGLPCILDRCWKPENNEAGVDFVAQMVRYVIESNYSGVHSDFEMGQGAVNSSHPAVPAYREFVSALSAGLARAGKQLVVDAGAWPAQIRTKDEITGLTQLQGKPSLMTMWPTYYAYPRECSDYCCTGCPEYFKRLRQSEVAGVPLQISTGFPVIYEVGLPPHQRSVGGGKACYIEHPPAHANKTCAGPSGSFGWNSSNLPPVIQLAASSGLTSATIYTFPEANQGVPYFGNNITYGAWTSHVAPWLLDALEEFLKSPTSDAR
jgi:hypothetical protein